MITGIISEGQAPVFSKPGEVLEEQVIEDASDELQFNVRTIPNRATKDSFDPC